MDRLMDGEVRGEAFGGTLEVRASFVHLGDTAMVMPDTPIRIFNDRLEQIGETPVHAEMVIPPGTNVHLVIPVRLSL